MANNIKNIAPLLASYFIDIEDDLNLIKENDKLIASRKDQIGHFYKYLNKLHDSWIIDTNVSAGTYSITLNDFTTHVFADALIGKKCEKFEDEQLVFPIRIEFQTTEVSYNIVDDDGNVSPIKITDIDEYLAENVIEITQDKLKIGLVAWKKGTPGRAILVLISAKSITVIDERDKAWAMIFSREHDRYYNYFKAQLEKGKFLSDVTKCKELIDEFDKTLN